MKRINKIIKFLFFILILVEAVVIYCAFSDYLNLLCNFAECKLVPLGWGLSIDKPIETIFNFILAILPFGVVGTFFYKVAKGEGDVALKSLRNIYNKFSTAQIVIIFFCLAAISYYLNKFYNLISSRVNYFLKNSNCVYD